MQYLMLVVTAICYGVGLAIIPAAIAATLIEHYQPALIWRVLAWAVVGALLLTPLALAIGGLTVWSP